MSTRRPTAFTTALAALALAPLALALGALAAGSAGAQCLPPKVGIADGDVVVTNLASAKPLIKVTDVSAGANTSTNQQVICGGDLDIANSIDFDREGRIWVSTPGGIVRTDPVADTQIPYFTLAPNSVSPEGIVKQRDGPIFLAQPLLSTLSQILRVDEVNPIASGFTPLGATGVPLGLIFDPAGDDPEDMLLADSGNPITGTIPGLYEITQAGGVIGIARNGFIATPFRAASQNDDFVYLSDVGGTVDRDGIGTLHEPETRPPQIVRVDRSVPFDFSDPLADGAVNQTVIFEDDPMAPLLIAPIGIEILEEDGVNPDVLLLVDALAGGGTLFRVEFDPNATTPTGVLIPVAQGLNLDTPYEVKIVQGIEPQQRRRIFFTDTDAASTANTGVYFVDPDATSGAYATGMTRPTGVVVDPADLNDLLVADADLPAIVRVVPATADTGTASTISSGGMLMEPTALIVDDAGDIIVADRGAAKILKIDPTSGAQSVVAENDLIPGNGFLDRPVAIGIDIDGYFQVADEGDTGDVTDAKLLRINPLDGRQFCVAKDDVFDVSQFPFDIDNVTDLVFDRDDATIYAIDTSPPDPDVFTFKRPILRFDLTIGFFAESDSDLYETPRGVAIAENRDILTVDAGDPLQTGDGRLLRLDPIIPNDPGDPDVVAGSENLQDPWGVAVAMIPRPSTAPTDTDGDGVLDPEDNCIDTPNPDQTFPDLGDPFLTETNRLGSACYGMCPAGGCSCDVDENGAVGISDFQLLIGQLGNDCNDDPSLDCSADCEATPDGIVGNPDFQELVSQLGMMTPGRAGFLVKFPDDFCPGDEAL